ncbi:hypothetical protein HK405_010027, partial [Cladochytrium tenue]
QASRRSKRPRTALQGNNEPRITVEEMKAREQEQLKSLARELQIESGIRRRLAECPSGASGASRLGSRVATGQKSFRHMPASGCGWRTARDTETDRRLYFLLRSKARGALAAGSRAAVARLLSDDIYRMFRDLEWAASSKAPAPGHMGDGSTVVSKHEELWVNKITPLSNLRKRIVKEDVSELQHETLTQIRQINHAVVSRGAILKVIFENDYLDTNHIARLCDICSDLDVAFIKTSTGYGFVKQPNGMYSYKGATVPHLKLMRERAKSTVQVKAAGGVRTLDDLLYVRSLGVTRIGATATVQILEDAKARGIGSEPVSVSFKPMKDESSGGY